MDIILLVDIGNTHTHIGLGTFGRVAKLSHFPTGAWKSGEALCYLEKCVGKARFHGGALCSVVPWATLLARRCIRSRWKVAPLELNSETILDLGIDYPKARTIGPDRLANALAAKKHFGAPVVVVDFGTAVTFDVVNGHGDYVGGIIAPGLSAMTTYLHEKTALLPAIHIREPRRVVGKSTEEAMLSGAVIGYRGLIRELIVELKKELGIKRLPVVATGGYAELIASRFALISNVDPLLTLEGLRLLWLRRNADKLPGVKKQPQTGNGSHAARKSNSGVTEARRGKGVNMGGRDWKGSREGARRKTTSEAETQGEKGRYGA